MTEKEVPKEDPTVSAEMSFFLTDGCTHVNNLTSKLSELEALRENLIKNVEQKDGKGYFVVHGSINSPYDFTIMPINSIVCISFKIKTSEDSTVSK